jgi:cbb3-type cytochrome oxidase maturation protein
MSLGEIVFIAWSLLMVIITLIYFVWAKESGQFKHIEKAKYDMLEEKDPLPWDCREKNSDDDSNQKPPTQKGGKQ